MKIRYGLFFFIVSILFSCNQSIKRGDISTIQVDLDNSTTLQLSDLIKEIEYVPLVANLSYHQIFQDWMEVKIFDDHLYIFQDGGVYANIFRFTLNGVNTQTYQLPVEGPGKVINASDFFIVGQELKVIDSYRSKIVSFDLISGALVGEMPINERFKKVAFIGEDYLFFARNWMEASPSNSYNLYTTGTDYKVNSSYLPIPSHLRNYLYKEYNFSNENGKELLFKNLLTDTLYGFSEGTVYPKYQIDLGDKWVAPSVYQALALDNGRDNRRKFLYDRSDQVFKFVNLFHSGGAVVLTNFYNGKFHYIIYNTKYGLARSYNQLDNDIDGGLLGDDIYWPRLMKDNQLFFILPTEDVVYDIQREGNGKNQSEAYKNLIKYEGKCDGILVICTLKDIASLGL
jgi:hypothetical protein